MFDPLRVLVGWLAPDARPEAYNDWRFVFTTDLPSATLLTLGAVLVLAIGASALGVLRLPAKKRALLIGLRVCAGILVFLLLLKPAIELRAVSKVRSRIALLIDGSRSMALATPDGTRAEVVGAHLAKNRDQLDRLAKEAVLEPALFGDRVRPLEAIPSVPPATEPKTDLARAISEIAWQSSGRDLGAVILYSDGADTEGLSVERARSIGAELGLPIYAVGFPKDASAADLAIRRVVGDDFAFVHTTVTFDVELEQRGLDLDRVPVTLKRDGELVATKEVSFDPEGRATVSFEFKPHRIGKLAYQVSVPVQAGEVVASNNIRSFVLKVIRDRIRVLQVAGRPSWDERFLRELLKRNPNVDLISFFILRSTTDLQKASPEELALIPFPVNELFTKELATFDVVIYQNFTYRPYRMAHYLQNVRDYVLAGGSFLMIGGDQSFEDGWYAGTPIASILPLTLGGAPAWDPGEYSPRLTKEGHRHPITRIGEAGEPPGAVFSRLPKLAGINPTLGLVPGAQALMVHPSLPENPPLVAIREVGQGRTMAVTTDSLWFWRFLAVGEGGAGREFDRFWGSSLRWLIRDPELARVRLKSDKAVFAFGDAVGAEARVLGPDYRGLPESVVRADLFKQGDSTSLIHLEEKTGLEGNAVLPLGQVAAGDYILKAEAFLSGERIGRAEEPIIVEAADVEQQSPFPRPELLAALAEGSGGELIDVSDPLPDIEVKETRKVEVDRTRQIPVWNNFVAFGALLLVVSAEWWIRRRVGLL